MQSDQILAHIKKKALGKRRVTFSHALQKSGTERVAFHVKTFANLRGLIVNLAYELFINSS